MFEKIKSSKFLQNILVLVSGTTLAQAIPILISPFVTRLYLPESFGNLMVYVSVISILSVVSTLRYEKAIIIPPEDVKAKSLVQLTQLLIIGFCLILVLLNVLVGAQLFSFLGIEKLEKYSWLIIIGVYILASDQSFYHWANRISAYKRMSLSKIGNNLASGFSSIVFGLLQLETFGLLFSKTLGLLSSLLINLQTFSLKNLKGISLEDLKIIAKEYIKFPTFLMPSHLMNAISLNGPPIMLAMYYAESEVGFFALTQRVVMLPVSIIARSVGDVFRQKATLLYNETGDYRSLYLKTLGGLFVLGLIPFFILIFFAPFLFSFVFGSDWQTSGEFAQIIAVLFLLQFSTSPLTNAFIISDKQQLELIWQISFLVCSILPIVIGYYFFESIYATLLIFVLARSASYILSIFLTLPFTIKKQ